jgi:hypothetical protein
MEVEETRPDEYWVVMLGWMLLARRVARNIAGNYFRYVSN